MIRYLVTILFLFVSIGPSVAGTILVLGDSLSAGHGIAAGESWVDLLQQKLDDQGYGHRVVNASMTGETTGGGLSRLPRALEVHGPMLVIVELGGNDGLRGLPIEQIRANLSAIIDAIQASGAAAVLAGMRIPPNYGPVYTEQFDALYEDMATSYQLPLIPFLLDGVALEPDLMQADGIHPNGVAQPVILANVWAVLEGALEP